MVILFAMQSTDTLNFFTILLLECRAGRIGTNCSKDRLKIRTYFIWLVNTQCHKVIGIVKNPDFLQYLIVVGEHRLKKYIGDI
jgi:hypothetical protein